jgi:CIC family chloride channel protein
LYVALGALAGLVAIAYNVTLLQTLAAAERLKMLPIELRAAMIGALVAVVAWFSPQIVGGGEALTQTALGGAQSLRFLPLVFLARFALGTISYAARTPGGLFAPLLVLGAQLGLMFGVACRWAWPQFEVPPEAFAVVGMAAFFTGVVRAPLTGIALIIEMTASMALMLPMVGASFLAMLIPTLAGNRPIYDSLREQPDKRA